MVPIYAHDLPAVSWQLLWWLIVKMDENCEVGDGWRKLAARDLKRDRHWLSKCGRDLMQRGLVDTGPRKRTIRVRVENIVG